MKRIKPTAVFLLFALFSMSLVSCAKEGLIGPQGEQGPQGEKGNDGLTPYIGDNGNWWIGEVDTGVKAEGQNGSNGVSIVSVEKTGSEGNTDYYTITFSNGTTFVFTVTNGQQGATGEQGETGPAGPKGDDGVSIVSIIKTSSDGLVDTYTITYSDGHTSTFIVTNGANGEQGIQGIPGNDGHTPVVTIGDNGNWFIDGTDSGVKAQGPKGDKGDDGLSAYEIYIKYHPEYTGTEEEWIQDLVNGNLREKYTVTFKSNGGSAVESQKVSYGHLVTRPADPTRTGYIFTGWYLNGEVFPFNSYQVYDDIILYATWKSENVHLTLDANGGEVEYNSKTVTYGVDYVLPTPTRENYYFEGWYYNDTELCPLSGVWTFSKNDITLKARWSGTQATITFAEDSNVIVSESSVTVEYGYYFSLPIPTILSGDPFIGWADDNNVLITDNSGDSIKKSSFKTNVVLHAVYYYEIYTVNDWLKLCSYPAGDPKLSCTYVLMNDLDFTGLSNASVSNFEGTLDGQGFRIIGMDNSMFASVGRTLNSSVNIKNIKFVNFSGNSIIEIISASNYVHIDEVSIISFKKDFNDYCDFNGIVKKVDSGYGKATLELTNCSILDEFATIETGLVDYLFSFYIVKVNNCKVVSNTKQAAFIRNDRFSEEWFESGNYFDTNIELGFCSNYGDTQYLVGASVGTYFYEQKVDSSHEEKVNTKKGIHNLIANNIINYGMASSCLFKNVYNLASYYERTFSNGYSVDRRLEGTGLMRLEKVLNFGSVNSILGMQYNTYKYPYYGYWQTKENAIVSCFAVSNCFNCGNTQNESVSLISNVSNNYCYLPLSVIADGYLEITSRDQINKDFFINTIGLDETRWDLDYINIEDEYGLPQIIY